MSSLSGVLFLPIWWQSKNCLEQVFPYLNQEEAESCWFRATWSYRTSAMWPWAFERMFLTCSFSGVLWSWISARRIFCCNALKRVPLAFLMAFVRRMLHVNTLSIAAPSHPAHSRSWLGKGSVPSQAFSRADLLSSSFRSEKSKKWDRVGGAGEFPQRRVTEYTIWGKVVASPESGSW